MESNQATRIIEKFGSEQKLQRALKAVGHDVSISRIYRWTYPKERDGTGGIIPIQQLKWVVKAARYHGILLSDAELNPVSRNV